MLGVCACSAPVVDEPPSVTTPEFPAADMETAPDLTGRLQQATDGAAARGAQLSVGFLDRTTGTYMGVGDTDPIETASVVKLFIADDILFRESRGEIVLTQTDLDNLAPMLTSSDDSAAEVLWSSYGDTDIVTRVASRYGLVATTPPANGRWWNTETTAADIVRYYASLLDGTGGLARDRADRIIGLLESFTPEGTDGYPQSFGIPSALPGETTRGVKQGWMCCVSNRWIHLSTGFVGDGARYVVAVMSREELYQGADGAADGIDTAPADDDGAKHARATVTGALKILFPTGTVAG
ncbi:putative lipoprotein LppW [Rhodococcoides trifolii]|uniref:Lipoprotein LppW n=1 Tax=Rhodococcoides trifolii TaxID=908250 RepID=A0A917FWD0_9NOCA|nr:putative lipoprotein LppW [Rhodococcus trifolii]